MDQLNALEERLGKKIEQAFHDLKDFVTFGYQDLSDRMDKMDAKFDKRFDAMDRRFDVMEARQDRTEDRFDAMDSRIIAVERSLVLDIRPRLDSLERGVKNINLKLENVIEPNIQIVAEGHLDLSRKLDVLLSYHEENKLIPFRVKMLENALQAEAK